MERTLDASGILPIACGSVLHNCCPGLGYGEGHALDRMLSHPGEGDVADARFLVLVLE